MKKFLTLLVGMITLASSAWAIDNFNPSDISGLSEDNVNSLIKVVAIGADHRAYRNANNLGVALGIDVGLDVTAVKTPSEFVTAMKLITANPNANVPSLLPLPRLNIHKGLPWGVDLGFGYITYQSLFKVYGLEASWTPISGFLGLPNFQGRFSMSYANLWFIQTHSYKWDVVTSKSFAVFEPYLGMGLVNWNGDLFVPVSAGAYSSGVSGHASSTNMHIFGGLIFKLLFLNLSAEYDWSSSGVSAIGGKVSIGL